MLTVFEADGGMRSRGYADELAVPDKLLSGKKSYQLGLQVFNERIPEYFVDENAVSSITGGWDARVIHAVILQHRDVPTYTYGMDRSKDIYMIRKQRKRCDHTEIILDDEIGLEPMIRSLYLSNGINLISRASLIKVYDALGERFTTVVGGFIMDTFMRGHMHLGSKSGHCLQTRLTENSPCPNDKELAIYVDQEKVRNYFCEKNRALFKQVSFGQSKMNFFLGLYHIFPSLFSGEVLLANHKLDVLSPAIDTHILKVLMSIKESANSYCQYAGHKRGDYPEYMLQSYYHFSHEYRL